ncbi:hypothetical protein D3C80_968310 [compost metagenome]
MKTAVDLQHPVAQRRRDAEHGAENGKNVNHMTNRAVYALTYQGVERRTQRQWQAMPEAEVRQDQRNDCVDGPRMQPPVEKRDLHRFARSRRGIGLAYRRAGEVHDGLSDAKEHQANTHAGGKQHGEPAAVAIRRLAVVRAELDIAITADCQEQHADQNQRHCQDVEPARIDDDPLLDLIEQGLGLALENHGISHDKRDQQCTAVKDRWVERAFGRWARVHRQNTPVNRNTPGKGLR